MCNIFLVMHKYVQMAVFIIIPILQRWEGLLSLCYLSSTIDGIKKITHVVSILVVSS